MQICFRGFIFTFNMFILLCSCSSLSPNKSYDREALDMLDTFYINYIKLGDNEYYNRDLLLASKSQDSMIKKYCTSSLLNKWNTDTVGSGSDPFVGGNGGAFVSSLDSMTKEVENAKDHIYKVTIIYPKNQWAPRVVVEIRLKVVKIGNEYKIDDVVDSFTSDDFKAKK